MAVQYGIKLWSINHDFFPEAAERFARKEFDFIELYTVPGKVDLNALAPIKHIPITIHAPHENHGFNVFTLTPELVEMFKRDVVATADALSSPIIVVHTGVGNSADKYTTNFAQIDDPRIVIENMPKMSLDGSICFGFDLYQLQTTLERLDKKLCLDIGHATKSAISQKLDVKEFLSALFDSFHPTYFHISDGDTSNERDEHLAIGSGNYDLGWIKNKMITASSDPIRLIFEVPKVGGSLENDIANINYFKAL